MFFLISIICPNSKIKTKSIRNSNDNIHSVDKTCIKTGIGCANEDISLGRSYSNCFVDILNCFFSRTSVYNGYGGVIYINNINFTMKIQESMFFNCSCENHGGAIYYSSSNSVIKMVCAYRCESKNTHHFALLQASNANQVEFLSVSCCSYNIMGYYSTRIDSGEQNVDSTNYSSNNAIQVSALDFRKSSSFNSSFCTFINNKVSISISLYFNTLIGTITTAIILHNDSPSSHGICSLYDATLKMKYCIYDMNQNTLFSVWSGSLEVSHSFISHSTKFSISKAVVTSDNNSILTQTPYYLWRTYQIQYYNSYYCNADDPITPPNQYITTNEELITTFKETPNESLDISPYNTLKPTVEFTYGGTNYPTLTETIPRTYEKCICSNNSEQWKEIRVIFSFFYMNLQYIIVN